VVASRPNVVRLLESRTVIELGFLGTAYPLSVGLDLVARSVDEESIRFDALTVLDRWRDALLDRFVADPIGRGDVKEALSHLVQVEGLLAELSNVESLLASRLRANVHGRIEPLRRRLDKLALQTAPPEGKA